ncbi:hypothetical protein [Streptomyces sp. NPDC005548]|uniref:hypothetical protein n=1 Tax=Streptomyces sp. NPDC005548 TaxID=3364724 RepID=UPI00369D692E
MKTNITEAPSLTNEQILTLIAHHEAGHAVVAHHHGLPVHSLELREDNTGGRWSADGITYVEYASVNATPFAVMALAGEIAGLKWLDQTNLRSEETVQAANADHDREESNALFTEDGVDVDWSAVEATAHADVTALWAQITAVANAAVEKGRLKGSEITALITNPTLCFRYQHGTPDGWTASEFESYEHIADIDAHRRRAQLVALAPAA